jgi:isocitrate dehydrogenase (NAD+)
MLRSYGNLVANIVAGLCGGSGVIPGANIGNGVAVFEQGARHVAVDLAGKVGRFLGPPRR